MIFLKYQLSHRGTEILVLLIRIGIDMKLGMGTQFGMGMGLGNGHVAEARMGIDVCEYDQYILFRIVKEN